MRGGVRARTPCYVRATVIGSPANLRAGAAAATVLAIAGCGGGESDGDRAAQARGTVAIERVVFPARQRIAQKSTFALTVRNAGDSTIADLTVTLRGFSAYEGPQAPGRPLWVVDEPPAGSAQATGNAYSTGRSRRAGGARCAGASPRCRPARTGSATRSRRRGLRVAGGPAGRSASKCSNGRR
jgi:hypothetical protein